MYKTPSKIECERFSESVVAIMRQVNAREITVDKSKPTFVLDTKWAGKLSVQVLDGGEWLACQFTELAKAKPYFKNNPVPGTFNQYSGKWNWHDHQLLDSFRAAIYALVM